MTSTEEQHDNLTFVTISEAGANHRICCISNQDAVGFKCEDEDFAIVVSDGVGSCKAAGDGSKYVVDAVISLFTDIKEYALQQDNIEMAKAIISYWKKAIGTNEINEYCATVKAVIKIGNNAKIISLGDGIAAITSNGISMAAPVDTTDFTNETKCLSSHISPEEIWIGEFHTDINMPYVVFCCTDGVANGLLIGKELELINEIEQNVSSKTLKAELEMLIGEIEKYSFDDKTLGVVKYERTN